MKTGQICVSQPDFETECFPVAGQPVFAHIKSGGALRTAIEFGTDWIDIEDSELFGDSESDFHIWGLDLEPKLLLSGSDVLLTPTVCDRKPAIGMAYAHFFASVGHRVHALSIRLLGKYRVQIEATLYDVTEETDDPITVLTADVVLSETKSIAAKF